MQGSAERVSVILPSSDKDYVVVSFVYTRYGSKLDF